MKRRAPAVFDILSLALVALTGLTLLCYGVVLVYPTVFFNPFPPRAVARVSPMPAGTNTPALPPTYTPTSTPTITPTSPPRPSRTPTGIPSPTPTWPATATPTPTFGPTRAPFPFVCEVDYRRPEYGSPWSGAAGHVEDMLGYPLPGYYARVECPGVGLFTHRAGENQRFNLVYGSEAAWEQACNPSGYQQMEVRMQLFNDQPDADGTYRAVSDLYLINLGGYASGSLGYVTCRLNWPEWQPERTPEPAE